MKEKTINFKVSEELHKEIKIKIAKDGKSLKEYCMDLIKEDLKKDKV